jgi:uncharacterized protein
MKKLIIILLAGLFLTSSGWGQDIPDPMQPPRMVNDFSGFLEAGDRETLEKKLQDFYYETSTQIYVVILDDIAGYDIADFTVRLGEKWGVGTKGNDNGAVILLNPSADRQHGDVYVATGYGLEVAVPDITAHHIVDFDMIPYFREQDYYGGIETACNTLMELTRGEYTADEYLQRNQTQDSSAIPAIVFILFVILFSIIGRARSARQYAMGHNVPFLLALFMASGSSKSHSGSFGSFRSGGGGFGGGGFGGGGFGGGGGGSFGGGGAGGSW